MSDITISDAEWIVMRVIWRLGKATAAEVIGELARSEKWSHRTIRTLLGRLVEKDVLATETDGNRYIYRPRVTQQKCTRTESRSFLDKVFGGDAAELLIHFTQEANISRQQIDELKRLLDAKQRSRE